MLLVPLLYMGFGLFYLMLRVRAGDPRSKDVVEAAIIVLFWPMHVISADAPVGYPEDDPVARLEHWLRALPGAGPLRDRLLDARAWATMALARGTPAAEVARVLRPMFAECEAAETPCDPAP